MIRLLLILSVLLGAPAYGAEVTPFEPFRVLIKVSEAKNSKIKCFPFIETTTTHLRSFDRFVVVDALPTFELRVRCEDDKAKMTWMWVSDSTVGSETKSKNLLVAESEIVLNPKRPEYGPSAIALIRSTLNQIPWVGELEDFKSSKGVKPNQVRNELGVEFILGKGTGRFEHGVAIGSAGTLVEPYLGLCIPIDIGRLVERGKNLRFMRIGYGVVTAAGPHSSRLEVFFLKKRLKSEKKAVFAFSNSEKMPRRQERMTRDCREKIGELEASTMSKLFSGDLLGLFSEDTIELNRINERAGVYYTSLRTRNGFRSPLMLNAYIQNEFDIGNFFHADLRGTRHFLTRDWEPSSRIGNHATEMTIAEMYLNGRFTWQEHSFILGGGLVLDKTNVPFENNGQTEFRKIHNRGSILLKYRFDWDDWWSTLRLGGSFAKGLAHRSINLDLNTRISDTWFFGADAYVSSFDRTQKGEPGYEVLGIGAHIGFDLVRTEKKNTGRKRK